MLRMIKFRLINFFPNDYQLQSPEHHHLSDHGYLSPDPTVRGRHVS